MAAAKRTAGDSDKIGRKARIEATGQQAAKARQTQRMIERLEEVDEPRKEWDLRLKLPGVEQLEQAIESFPGTLLIVSHDRQLLSNISLTRRFEVDGGQVVEVNL